MTIHMKTSIPKEVKAIIEHFQMESHPEGGFSKLLFEDSEMISESCLPDSYCSSRPYWNAIYYLLPKGSISILHRLHMDEMWNHYMGGSLDLFDLSLEEGLKKIVLGKNIFDGQLLSYVIPKGHWIAAKPSTGSPYCLVSCVTCPGFTFSDWEKGERKQLLKLYPDLKDLIIEFTCA
ncbi:MAG: cupin domain-containing protein [Chlamydiia bacterium]|nr:cupin domain-containing protein [Chlamydiia bacterium]